MTQAWKILRGTIRRFAQVNGPFLACGLAFNVLLYCFPLALLLVAVLGYVLGGSEQAVANVQREIGRLLPRSQRAITNTLEEVIAHRGALGAAGLLSLVVFGSFLFGSARHVLNSIFEVVRPRSLLHGIVVDLLVMLGAGLLLTGTTALTWLLTIVRNWGVRVPVLAPLVGLGTALAGFLLGLLLLIALCYLCYRFLPEETLREPALWLAAVTSAGLFQLAKWAFAIYVSRAGEYAALYGALGGLIFFVFWLYYACVVFILGAIVGWTYDHLRNDSVAPPVT